MKIFEQERVKELCTTPPNSLNQDQIIKAVPFYQEKAQEKVVITENTQRCTHAQTEHMYTGKYTYTVFEVMETIPSSSQPSVNPLVWTLLRCPPSFQN